MCRTDHDSWPAELTPQATDEDAEIVLCAGHDGCDQTAACGHCMIVPADLSMAH